jgi:hypothetical protein
MVILEKTIPQNLATLAHSFLTKLLCMSHAGFIYFCHRMVKIHQSKETVELP